MAEEIVEMLILNQKTIQPHQRKRHYQEHFSPKYDVQLGSAHKEATSIYSKSLDDKNIELTFVYVVEVRRREKRNSCLPPSTHLTSGPTTLI